MAPAVLWRPHVCLSMQKHNAIASRSAWGGEHAPTRQWHAARCKTTQAPSTAPAEPAHPPELQFSIRRAVSTAELRAAAYLRASSFYVYPAGRSEWAARSHLRMKSDAEWAAMTAKVEGTDPAYAHVSVTPFIVCIPDDPSCAIAAQVAADMDASSKLPVDSSNAPLPLLAVASLDLNQGRNLPAEELIGRCPQGSAGGAAGDASVARAYLSNVCVARAARRLGLGRRLIQAVEVHAAAAGVTHMYVHVVHNNQPALQLYTKLGYAMESEESEQDARAKARPRRLLLCKPL